MLPPVHQNKRQNSSSKGIVAPAMMKNKAKNTLPVPCPATTGRKKIPQIDSISNVG